MQSLQVSKAFFLAALVAVLDRRSGAAAQNTTGDADSLPGLSEPDAWGTSPLRGFRLDRPYPGVSANGTDDDDDDEAARPRYELDLRIKQHVLDANLEKNLTYVTVQMRPPAPGEPGSLFDARTGNATVDITDVERTWRVLMMGLGPYPVVDDEVGQDGSCPPSVVSEDCEREVRDHILSQRAVVTGQGMERPGSLLPEGAACGRYEWYSYMEWGLRSASANRTRTLWDYYDEDGTDDRVSGGSPYDVIGVATVPVVVIWGHSGSGGREERLDDDHVTFACVKVDTAREGLALPKGAAARLGSAGMGRWVIGLTAAATAVLLC